MVRLASPALVLLSFVAHGCADDGGTNPETSGASGNSESSSGPDSDTGIDTTGGTTAGATTGTGSTGVDTTDAGDGTTGGTSGTTGTTGTASTTGATTSGGETTSSTTSGGTTGGWAGRCSSEMSLWLCGPGDCAFEPDTIACQPSCNNIDRVCTATPDCEPCDVVVTQLNLCPAACENTKQRNCANTMLGCFMMHNTCDDVMTCIDANL